MSKYRNRINVAAWMGVPMATSDSGLLGSRIRPIEIALDNFNTRMQGSLSSQISNLKTKVEYIESRLSLTAGKAGTLLPGGVDLRAILEEIRSFVQKDLLKDTTHLIDEKLAEFQGLLSRIKKTISEVGAPQIRSTAQEQQTSMRPDNRSITADSSAEIGEKDNEIASLREEINRLYNLTEREPRFQPFWILRDAYPSWLQITKIARTLNATPGEVHENLKTFERLGLVQIEKGEARATRLVRPNKPSANR